MTSGDKYLLFFETCPSLRKVNDILIRITIVRRFKSRRNLGVTLSQWLVGPLTANETKDENLGAQ